MTTSVLNGTAFTFTTRSDEPPAVWHTPGLAIDFHVRLDRQKRSRCPVCGHRRVLFALTAFAADQPIGYGLPKCLADAGLRRS